MSQQFVPVVGSTGKPLMPTTNQKADKLIERGRAIRRFDRGLFYIQLVDREDGYTQPIVIGIDPGSKKEAFTVKSEAHTLLNLQADAVKWVSEAEETSTTMRRSRRGRKTPYRECRPTRQAGKISLPPSTKARWQWKLRLCRWLARYYPIDVFVVEDVKAKPHKGKGGQWNTSFSPIQVGKEWLYWQLGRLAPVRLVQGFDTYQERQRLGLRKSSNKLSDSFEAHCVDSWTLANLEVGGHTAPDNTAMLYLVPLRFHRRQLHRLQPAKGGVRNPYGGTDSLGFKRGSWVNHPKWGVCYVGGSSDGRISLHHLHSGKRLCQNAKPHDLTFLCTASWRLWKGESAISPLP
ncbi:MAG: RRXRR domain-containing protein [Chloroflexota bacterium]